MDKIVIDKTKKAAAHFFGFPVLLFTKFLVLISAGVVLLDLIRDLEIFEEPKSFLTV